jgi:hypothetical protein
MVVNIYKWNSNWDGKEGTRELELTLTMKDGKVVCSDPEFLKSMYRQPPRNVEEEKPGEFVTPDAGVLFLKNLKHHFRSAHSWAEEVP